MKIKALLFDFDETLLVNEQSTRDAAREAWLRIIDQCPQVTPQQAEETYMAVRDEFWSSSDEATMHIIQQPKEIIRSRLWEMVLDRLKIEKIELVPKLVEKFGQMRYQTWMLYPDSLAILNKLKPNYQLVMITNGVPEIQRAKMDKVNMEAYFNPIIISGEIGVSKPDPKYFQIVLEMLKLSKEECVVIGDSVRNDVGGAKNAGITSIWINRSNLLPRPSIQPDYEIHSLTELLPILAKLG
jgi:putative hydrolase of the HAD superfamily